MKKLVKKVTTFFFLLYRNFFIIKNSYILQIIQQQIAVQNEKLHYIKKKIVTQKKTYLVTGVLASSFIN